MTLLERATRLLLPPMGMDRRDTLLTQAFHAQHRPVYDAIAQAGATDAFTVACVRTLLEVARSDAGDEKHADFAELIRELDASCARVGSRLPVPRPYTDRETDAAAAAFADCLIEASEHAPLKVVLTLRADFTGRAIGHRRLRDCLQQATVFLGDMTRDEREQAIRGPAQKAGLRFEAGLVSRILDDVGDEPGNLPLLEFCLTQLHARRSAISASMPAR